MAMRIRHALKKEPLAGLLKGTVEADETDLKEFVLINGDESRNSLNKSPEIT